MRTIFILLCVIGFVMLLGGIALICTTTVAPVQLSTLVGGLILIIIGLFTILLSWIVIEDQSTPS